MSVRRLTAVLTAVCAIALLAPMSALAATKTTRSRAHSAVAVTSLTNIPVTGTGITNHKTFKGTFSVQRVVSRDGKSYAIGTLAGMLGKRAVHRNNVAIPLSVASPSGHAHDAASCPILHLDLGPLNLNLLGLHVHLNQVVLDITATSGNGMLLGNLLCAVSNLLNGTGGPLPLSQVTSLLNILNSVLSSPGLLNL